MWSKWNQMSVRTAMISLAGKPGFGEQRRWLQKVADAANISRRAARDAWRGHISDDGHRVVKSIRAAAEAKAVKEANALADEYKQIIAGLSQIDPDFHGPHILALLDALRAVGRLDRTGD